jgi:hypothetical protein
MRIPHLDILADDGPDFESIRLARKLTGRSAPSVTTSKANKLPSNVANMKVTMGITDNTMMTSRHTPLAPTNSPPDDIAAIIMNSPPVIHTPQQHRRTDPSKISL